MKLHEYSGLKVVLCIFSNYEKKKKICGNILLNYKISFQDFHREQ
jgi:hypothetical protein